ncbi:unnamed protein product [Linum tenue]|uniref:Uncharacterized protein n=1 Tax=Linum tenue TaxID=586396 RepID=A0AAV0IYZ6_9ROSI|nr:unnamed protein product [Linum tenue]
MNLYYQIHGTRADCDFSGTANFTNTDPSKFSSIHIYVSALNIFNGLYRIFHCLIALRFEPSMWWMFSFSHY